MPQLTTSNLIKIILGVVVFVIVVVAIFFFFRENVIGFFKGLPGGNSSG